MRLQTKDGKVIFGLEKVQDFFIQVYDEDDDLVFAMQQSYPISFEPFSFDNLIRNVKLHHLQEIFNSVCKHKFCWTFRDYFKECFLLDDDVIDSLLKNVSELDDEAIKGAYSFIAADGQEHQLILKDYRFYEYYSLQCDAEEYDRDAGDALYFNTYTQTHEIYTIWLDEIHSDESTVSFYLCLPNDADADDDEDNVVMFSELLNIHYDTERIKKYLMSP